jgi:ribonucleoside-diphosphate reductase alpha chain
MLPDRRSSVSFTLEFQSERYDVTTGFYVDNRLGEIFINRIKDKVASRLGQQLDAVCRDTAILLSLALQHGVKLDDLKHSITRDDDSSPMSIVGAIIDSIEVKDVK